jgi:large subunit ribosomal protein L23
MITPVFTEKSLKLAKEGKYTFSVSRNAKKPAIKSEIGRTFGVKVVGIKSTAVSGETGRNARGNKYAKLGGKKVIAILKDGDKIDVFEESKK